MPVVFAFVAAAAGFTSAWQIQAMRHDAAITTLKNEYLKRDFRALENAHAKTISLQASKDAAEREARIRQTALARDIAANRDALVSLHSAADQALRRANDTHGACLATAAAQRDVLDSCSARLVEVGAAADQHVSDIKTLTEGWPK